MSVSSRDMEKLKAIGYTANRTGTGKFVVSRQWGEPGGEYLGGRFDTEEIAFRAAQIHSQTDGLKATMADKVRLLSSVQVYTLVIASGKWFATRNDTEGEGDTPEVAVDTLFWKVA